MTGIPEPTALDHLRAELDEAIYLARVSGWHIAEIRKLHNYAGFTTIAECSCGLDICDTLRALSTLERLAPAGQLANYPGHLHEIIADQFTDLTGAPDA
jgi:hypothetical protein